MLSVWCILIELISPCNRKVGLQTYVKGLSLTQLVVFKITQGSTRELNTAVGPIITEIYRKFWSGLCIYIMCVCICT